jgi:hypothetical protein
MAFSNDNLDKDGRPAPEDIPPPPVNHLSGKDESETARNQEGYHPAGPDEAKEDMILQFVDFDVWVGTLEVNFGVKFEKVLTREFGPDWVNMINSRIAAGEDFQAVVQDLKHKLGGPARIERDIDDMESGGITFEALGRAEVFGEPAHGDEHEDDDVHHLLHAIRKELPGDEQLIVNAQPDKFQEETLLLYQDKDKEKKSADDDLILMDRRDFSRLSYYASKEMRRYDNKNLNGKTTKGDWWKRALPDSPWARAFVLFGVLFLAWALFCMSSYIYFASTSDRLLVQYPPDLIFRPSSTLHNQGVLARINVDSTETPLAFFFYRPAIHRLETNFLQSQGQMRYELSVARPGLLVIPQAQNRDSVAVVAHYSQRFPQAFPALLGIPLFSLYVDGIPVIQAFETPSSAMLPGLLHLELRGLQNEKVGEAYLARNRLNIRWEARDELSGADFDTLAARLVLLFTLLEA